MKVPAREVSRISIFTSLAVAAGFILIGVPNVELVSVTVFLAGMILGSLRGAMVGGMAMGIFSTFNPLGLPIIPVLVAQILSMALVGAIGGVFKGKKGSSIGLSSILKLAVTGFTLTILYDLSTNFAFAVAFGLMAQFLKIVLAGLVFSALHVVSNTVLFPCVGLAMVKVLDDRPIHRVPGKGGDAYGVS